MQYIALGLGEEASVMARLDVAANAKRRTMPCV